MKRTLTAIVAALALTGCKHEPAHNISPKLEEPAKVQEEYTPSHVKVRKGDLYFSAKDWVNSSVRGTLIYTNAHGELVTIGAIRPAESGPFTIHDMNAGNFYVDCNPMETKEAKEICPMAAVKWVEKCKELDCDGHTNSWLKNRPSLSEWYL